MVLEDLRQLIELRQIMMTQKKMYKIRDLINMGKYDADLAKYNNSRYSILAIQGVLDDIDNR